MSNDTPERKIRRALTTEELQAILDRIAAATNASDVAVAVILGSLEPLLRDDGIILADLGPGQTADPSRYAIPETQWQLIASTAMNRTLEWGGSHQLGFELANRMPSAYDDPSVAVLEVPLADYRPDYHRLTVPREACDVIADCGRYLQILSSHYGKESARYLAAAESWYPQLVELFSMSMGAETHVRRDGDLSLIVTRSGGLVYGVIFHPERRWCTHQGCRALISDDGTAHAPYRDAVVLDHDHTPAYPLDAPVPGTWSFHS